MTFLTKSLAGNENVRGNSSTTSGYLILTDLNNSSPCASIISKSNDFHRPTLLTAE